jgi:hypothetical protein
MTIENMLLNKAALTLLNIMLVKLIQIQLGLLNRRLLHGTVLIHESYGVARIHSELT